MATSLLYAHVFIISYAALVFGGVFPITRSTPSGCNITTGFKNGKVRTYGGNMLIEYICDEGFFSIGRMFGACITETASWTIGRPKCVASGCPYPSVHRNIHVRLIANDAVAIFSCGRSHYLFGETDKSYCNGTHWSQPFPTCAVSSARSISEEPKNRNLPGIHVTDDTAFFNATALNLAQNLKLSDRTCFRYRYKAPPKIANATVTPRYIYNNYSRDYALIANYTCNAGYVLEHPLARYLFCKNYQWTAVIHPKCVKLVDSSWTNGALAVGACEKRRRIPLCHQICISGASGNYACDCKRGFRLHSNGRDCYDMNECLYSNGGCEQRCYNTYGSRLCSCNEGYQSFGTICIDVDECADPDLNDCPSGCNNVPGSYQCNSSMPGFQTGEDGSLCEDEDECSEYNGGCDDKCENTFGSYRCHCDKKGYHLSADKHNCTDVDECQKHGRKICGNGQCVNTPGSYRCDCIPGFVMGKSNTYCQDVDECKVDNGGCEYVCKNSVGSFSCYCAAGFTLMNNSRDCTDTNECVENNGGCEDQCINTPGSYHCWCNQIGYILTEDGRNCTDCEENQYIIEDEKLCVNCPNNSIRTSKTAVSIHDCVCKPGFLGNPVEGTPCEDIDECEDLECEYGCENTAGSAQCICPVGYHLLPGSLDCVDTDECADDNGGCNDTCRNTQGSYTCLCTHPGTTLAKDNTTCEDINECLVFNNNCSQTCTNIWGGAVCGCLPGFSLTHDLITCTDINECNDPELSGCQDLCVDTEGSYHCECSGNGLKLSWDGKSCSDINECMEGFNECEDMCVNTFGSYICKCNETEGLTISSDGRTCQDLNECTYKETNLCDQICINLKEGYRCECEDGYLQRDEYYCDACPKDTYHYKENGTCVQCPEKAITNDTAKSSIADCYCMAGYKGDLALNETCEDIDECAEESEDGSKCSQLCANTEGSYYCACRKGYNLHYNLRNCTDIDECKYGYHFCIDQCVNLEGSFKCGCREGFTLHWDGRYCTDINECYLGTHQCQDHCENTWGSYICGCLERGMRLDSDGRSCVSTGTLPRCPTDMNILVNDGVVSSHVALPSVVYSGQYNINPDWVRSGQPFPLGITQVDILVVGRSGEEVACSFNVTITSRCAIGSYKTGGHCSLCPAGTYQNEAGQLVCKKCPPGTYQDEEGTTKCKFCSFGTYQNETGQSGCKDCPAGTYVDDNGQPFCQRCRPGSYQNQVRQTSCKLCEKDSFQNRYGQDSCEACGERKYQDERGHTYCKRCPPLGYLNLYSHGNNAEMLRKCKDRSS